MPFVPAPRPLATTLAATLAAVLALGILSSTADAQRSRRGGSDMRMVLDTTYRFARNGLLDAEQISGDVTVTTWDRPEVRVRAWIERGRVTSQLTESRVRLRVESERGNRDIGDSRFEVTVPTGTRVRVASVSGDVTVAGTGGEVDASSVSGDLEVKNTTGPTSVKSVSGDVSVRQVSGDLSVRTVSGDVDVDQVEGDVQAASVSGEITLAGLRSRNVTARSTSGEIDFSGAVRPDGRYQFNSHSGEIRLSLPPDVGADLSVRTFSGELESDFPVTLGGRNRTSTRTLEFTLGNGGARITAETFSGDVLLRRAGGRSRR